MARGARGARTWYKKAFPEPFQVGGRTCEGPLGVGWASGFRSQQPVPCTKGQATSSGFGFGFRCSPPGLQRPDKELSVWGRPLAGPFMYGIQRGVANLLTQQKRAGVECKGGGGGGGQKPFNWAKTWAGQRTVNRNRSAGKDVGTSREHITTSTTASTRVIPHYASLNGYSQWSVVSACTKAETTGHCPSHM